MASERDDVGRAYDAVVVGSGPAGSAFARTLADIAPYASILVVEAGPRISDPPGGHVRNIADLHERARAQKASEGPRRRQRVRGDELPASTREGESGTQLRHIVRAGTFLVSDGMSTADPLGLPAASMSSNVGGMGAHWTGACPKPAGRERIAEIPEIEMSEALDAADALLGVTQTAFGDAPRADAIVRALSAEFPRDPGVDRPVQPMPLAARASTDGVLHWAGTDGILGPALATGSVELRAETLATAVVMTGGDVTGISLRDLASDTTELVECSLVFVAGDSFRTPQLLHASGVRPWSLGRYLNDHPDARTFVELKEELRQPPEPAGVTWIPYSDEGGFPFHCQVMQLDASPVGLILGGGEWSGSTVGVVVFGTKELSPDDRVEFSDEQSDAYGMPALKISYHRTAGDLETERRLLEECRRIAEVLGTPVVEPRILPPGASYHFMGTVRLGDDPATSVCDPSGAVWGVGGLYVGGNGLIPTSTACNPTVTSVALAIRSARAAARGLEGRAIDAILGS